MTQSRNGGDQNSDHEQSSQEVPHNWLRLQRRILGNDRTRPQQPYTDTESTDSTQNINSNGQDATSQRNDAYGTSLNSAAGADEGTSTSMRATIDELSELSEEFEALVIQLLRRENGENDDDVNDESMQIGLDHAERLSRLIQMEEMLLRADRELMRRGFGGSSNMQYAVDEYQNGINDVSESSEYYADDDDDNAVDEGDFAEDDEEDEEDEDEDDNEDDDDESRDADLRLIRDRLISDEITRINYYRREPALISGLRGNDEDVMNPFAADYETRGRHQILYVTPPSSSPSLPTADLAYALSNVPNLASTDRLEITPKQAGSVWMYRTPELRDGTVADITMRVLRGGCELTEASTV